MRTVDQLDMENERNLELSEFHLQLARELIEEYGSKRPQIRGRPSTDSPLHLTVRHFIGSIRGDTIQKRYFVRSHTVKRGKNEVLHDLIVQIV